MKLSIITINLNDYEGLEKTINSVINQSFPYFEFIIIDGGSNDGSTDVIKKYESKVKYWISEVDNGIYQAMNKGISKSTGDYCLFLNSGDSLFDNNTLLDVFQEEYNSYDILYGDAYYENREKKWLVKYPKDVTLRFFLCESLCHQSTFIKRSLFTDIGNYSESNKFVSDWEFFLKVYISKKYKFKHINRPICFFNTNGMSLNLKFDKTRHKERLNATVRYFDPEVIQILDDLILLEKKYNLIVNSKFYSLYNLLYNNKIYKYFKY